MERREDVIVASKRQPRQSREDLRALLLDTGRSILHEEGLGTGAEALTFKRVFDRVEDRTGLRITNASVIRRVWENQAEYQADVLATIAQHANVEEIDLSVEAISEVVDAVDLSTPLSRQAAMRELCRVGGEDNARAVSESRHLPLWVGVWALAAVGEPLDHRQKIEAALRTGYEAFTGRIEEIDAAMTAHLGFRLREQFTLRQFAIAVDLLGQGYGLRSRVDDSVRDVIVRRTGPLGEPQEWTLFAVAFEALVLQFFEVDPDWIPLGADPGVG